VHVADRDLLVNCDGDAFFCYQQEMERPLFNLFKVDRSQLNLCLEQYEPGIYRFCRCCPRYVAS